ncbi:serine protease [Aureimonas sp. AU4]|uniref:trypsin-like serine peptidase n=1 Tax=Aureimonas sp. AU4 TaxID=1638163 RepID=UPI000783BAE1|nr:trypsin-like serine protease [Aureimonas sp. AU4]
MRIVIALLSILAAATPSHAQEVDNGTRHRVDISAPPWNAVGQVNTAAYSRCTGILISRQMAVTAAHCLFNRAAGRFLAPSSVHFVLGYDRGAYAFQTVASEIRMDPAQDGTRTLVAAPRDWAVLVLADAAPISITPLPVADVEPETGAELSAAGFGRDRAYALTVAHDCRSMGLTAPDLLAMRCPVIQGYSGGPVLNGAGELVGITVAGTKTRDGDVALAVASGAWRAAVGL